MPSGMVQVVFEVSETYTAAEGALEQLLLSLSSQLDFKTVGIFGNSTTSQWLAFEDLFVSVALLDAFLLMACSVELLTASVLEG